MNVTPVVRPASPPDDTQKSWFSSQAGQALAEGMVALLFLLCLWVAVGWLGRLQTMALTAQHASSYAAFTSARFNTADIPQLTRVRFFSGPAHQWQDRRGKPILDSVAEQVEVNLDRHAPVPLNAQPAGTGVNASSLRQDWRLSDSGILKAQVVAAPRAAYEDTKPSSGGSFSLGLDRFDTAYPVLRRHISILTDAGHASSDSASQLVLQGSDIAWGRSADASYALGRKLSSVMAAIDSGWSRPRPIFDWLYPWAGYVPQRHLVTVPGAHDAR